MHTCLNCGQPIDEHLTFCDDLCELEYAGVDDEQVETEEDDEHEDYHT